MSLVEILVVIGVLIALLLPAVQSAREAARKIHCQSNIRQIALAMHGYAYINKEKLPFIQYWRGIEPLNKNDFSWRLTVLPWLELASLYARVDTTTHALDPRNLPATRTRVPVYECPSVPSDARRFEDGVSLSNTNVELSPDMNITSGATTDYASLTAVRYAYRFGVRDNYAGALSIHSGLIVGDDSQGLKLRRQPRLADIVDGLSQTILITEYARSWLNLVDESHAHSRLWLVTGDGDGRVPPHFASMEELLAMLSGPRSRENDAFIMQPLHSYHPGGAYVAMCDGSVRWLAHGTPGTLLLALFTREEGDSQEMYEQLLAANGGGD